MKKSIVFLACALFFLTANASAQIVYIDVVPDLTSTGTYNLDLNNDGTIDFVIATSVVVTPKTPCRSSSTHYLVTISTTGSNQVLNNTSHYPLKLASGSAIGSTSAVWITAGGQRMAASGKQCYLHYNGYGYTPYWGVVNPGLWFNATDGYLGLKVVKGGNNYYGWARMGTTNATSFTIKEYAYDNTPDHSILTGSTSGARVIHQSELPESHQLKVFPNPVASTATISFFLSESQEISIFIVDVRGQVVKAVSEVRPQGESEIEWTTNGLAAGVYFLRFQSAEFSHTEKIIVAR